MLNFWLTGLLSGGCAINYKSGDGDRDGFIENDCNDGDPNIGAPGDAYADADGDGYGDPARLEQVCAGTAGYVADDTDCDDTDPDISPDTDEICDGLDNDCDESIDDEDDSLTDGAIWYADSDGDTYGDNNTPMQACDQPEGTVADNTDCNDTDADYYPGAPTECDAEDRNCDGIADTVDGDGDGVASCEGDCDDADPLISPDALEECDADDIDENCNGLADDADPDGAAGKVTRYTDADGDGYGDTNDIGADYCDPPSSGVSETDDDCDDADSSVNPLAAEVCDEIDNDCDGDIDDDDPSLDTSTASTWYADTDGDSFGNISSPTLACNQPSGTVSDNTDCDDADSAVNPLATEVCDIVDIDEDCNGASDDDDASATGKTSYYTDSDGDGYGDKTAGAVDYCDPPSGVAPTNDDCDDSDIFVNPAMTEVNGNGVDDDCDAATTYAIEGNISLADADSILVGGDADLLAGNSVSFVGDLNGDGVEDILVGAPGEATYGLEAGAIYVIGGSSLTSGLVDLALDSQARLFGASSGDQSGYSVAGVGDLDGNGYEEFLAGALGEDSAGISAGAAYLVSGPVSGDSNFSATVALYGEASGDYAGISVAGPGDVDGDTVPDLLVGAYDNDEGGINAGVAYLLFGPVTGSTGLGSSNARLIGENAGDEAGRPVSGAGDVDGDGSADLLVGASLEPSGGAGAGAAYLVLGPVSGDFVLSGANGKYTGEAAGDRAGLGVSQGGDINGDGYDDMLVGADAESTGAAYAGAAYLVLGPGTWQDSLGRADAKLTGESAGDTAGFGLAGGGDVDADGYDDPLIGAYSDDTEGSGAGAAYVVYGPFSGTISLGSADAKLLGETAGGLAGWAVANNGDPTNDGFDDLLIGARGDSTGGSNAGAVYFLTGGGL